MIQLLFIFITSPSGTETRTLSSSGVLSTRRTATYPSTPFPDGWVTGLPFLSQKYCRAANPTCSVSSSSLTLKLNSPENPPKKILHGRSVMVDPFPLNKRNVHMYIIKVRSHVKPKAACSANSRTLFGPTERLLDRGPYP